MSELNKNLDTVQAGEVVAPAIVVGRWHPSSLPTETPTSRANSDDTAPCLTYLSTILGNYRLNFGSNLGL